MNEPTSSRRDDFAERGMSAVRIIIPIFVKLILCGVGLLIGAVLALMVASVTGLYSLQLC